MSKIRETSQCVPPHLSKSPFDRDKFEVIRHMAKSSGLTSDDLMLLCLWMESTEINEKNKLKLIECLIPDKNGGTIPVDVCIRLTWLLKTSNISLKTKIELLKWMICAHPFMETSGRFQMLYENFLGFLKNKKMQPYAAQLVYMCTQKKHVTFRRTQFIFKLIEEFGQQPYFTLILRVYIAYCPDYFEDEIQEGILGQLDSLGVYPDLFRNVHLTYEPNFSNIFVTTQEPSNSGMLSESCTSETLSFKFPPFSQLYKQYRELERSTNVSKILKSPLRNLISTSRFKHEMQDYISYMLFEEIDSEGIVEKHLELIQMQHPFPGIIEIAEFLLLKHNNPNVAEVICYEPICCFNKISYSLQVIQEKLITIEDATMKCQWLNSLTKMLCYWILQCGESISCDGKCTENFSSGGIGSDISMHHNATDEISKLVSQIDVYCESLIMDDCSPFILNRILAHYEMVAIARKHSENFIPCFPSHSVFQLSMFSLSLLTLDTLSRLMLRIRAIHDLQKKTDDLEIEEVMTFQASCSDIKKAFLGGLYKSQNTYKIITFKGMNKQNIELKNAFLLHKHPALSLLIMKFEGKELDKNFIMDPHKRSCFLKYLAENKFQNFVKLITLLYK